MRAADTCERTRMGIPDCFRTCCAHPERCRLQLYPPPPPPFPFFPPVVALQSSSRQAAAPQPHRHTAGSSLLQHPHGWCVCSAQGGAIVQGSIPTHISRLTLAERISGAMPDIWRGVNCPITLTGKLGYLFAPFVEAKLGFPLDVHADEAHLIQAHPCCTSQTCRYVYRCT